MFNYYAAADIKGHVTPGSGEEFNGYVDVRKIKEVLHLGGILDEEQIENIWKELGLSDGRLFAQHLATESTAGGVDGLTKAIMALVKATVSQ
jgi:hypothetical protein